MASFGIGAKLRQERVGQGLAIDDISRKTRIAPRFLEAIETEDFSGLPGLVFTRSFVRQYAMTLKLDPEPFLAELPKQDELTAPLPNPPQRARSSFGSDGSFFGSDGRMRSVVWLILAGIAAGTAYMRFNHSTHAAPPQAHKAEVGDKGSAPSAPVAIPAVIQTTDAAKVGTPPTSSVIPIASTAPVQVSLTANEDAWIDVSADGKAAFTGTLKPNETKDVSAAEQIRISTGNAGGLTISLNGKTLESLGSHGQVRIVRLTAEGPQFLSKAPQPAVPAPL